MDLPVLLFIAAVLASLSALFSAMETAFFALQPSQIRRLREEYPALAVRLDILLHNPRRLLSALLLADVCSNVPLIILGLWSLRDIAHDGLRFVAAAFGIFAVIVILCDLAPKIIALRSPIRTAALGIRPISFLMPVLDPLTLLLQRCSDAVARWVTPAISGRAEPLSEEELETLIHIGTEEGVLQETESEIIQEILKLSRKTARDCMLPRVDMVAIPDDLTNEQAATRLRQHRFRRVPVHAETPDDLLGILDVQAFLLNETGPHYTERLTPPSYVPETMNAIDLLRNFLRHPQRLAIVVDEFGGTEGIITLHDIVDHLLSDALPTSEQELYIENFGAGRLIAAGNARLDDLEERLGIPLEEEGIDTIGGLVFNHLGYLPKPGETVQLDSLRIIVRRASRQRIQELLIEPQGAMGRRIDPTPEPDTPQVEGGFS